MSEKLKNCPFCGKQDGVSLLGAETFQMPQARAVECRFCGVRMGAYVSDTAENNEIKAINNWNNRAVIQIKIKRIEGAKPKDVYKYKAYVEGDYTMGGFGATKTEAAQAFVLSYQKYIGIKIVIE